MILFGSTIILFAGTFCLTDWRALPPCCWAQCSFRPPPPALHDVAGALIAAPLGAYIQYFEERMGATRSFSIAAAVDAAMLMLTTAIAFYFAFAARSSSTANG